MSNDVIDQLRIYLDFAADEASEEALTAAPTPKPVLPSLRRGPVLAAITAVLVLAVGIPALLLGGDSGGLVGSQLLHPLDVGVERVWPDSGFAGGPDQIAEAFAKEALGWVDVGTTSNPDASSEGPVWTTIHHEGSQDLDVLSIPVDEGRRALIQVGTNVVTVGMETDGQLVGIPQVSDAVSAILHIRFVEPDRVEVVQVEQADLERGRAEVGTGSRVGGIVIVYLDADGAALTAAGGHFGPFDTPTPTSTLPRESSTTTTTAAEPTADDRALVDAFVSFAKDPSSGNFTRLPLADEVSLGLGPAIIRSIGGESLRDPEAWEIDVAEFRAYAGPFSPLDLLSSLDGHTVQVGEHPHCASPPQPPPTGLSDLRRVSVQPLEESLDSCLMWTTVDFFVSPSGRVAGITMDLWEP